MAVIKYKIYRGDIKLFPDQCFGICGYCDPIMTLPEIDNDQKIAVFKRRNHIPTL